MKVSGHSIREYCQLLSPMFGLIAVAWLLRGLLAYLEATHWILVIVSISLVLPVCVLLAVLLIYIRNFGSYTAVVFATLLLVSWAQVLICIAIVFSVATGISTVYSYPEYSLGINDPYHVRHILGHLTFGIGWGTLVGSAMGSFLLFFLRRFAPGPSTLV